LGIASASKLCQSSSICGPVGHREAELGEDADRLEADLGQEVEVAGRGRAARQRHVEDPGQVGGARRGDERARAWPSMVRLDARP
jgi:hypothetical protein